jgi:hypothetical protein
VAHVVNIGERLEAKGVSLKVLEQSIDTSTPTVQYAWRYRSVRARIDA